MKTLARACGCYDVQEERRDANGPYLHVTTRPCEKHLETVKGWDRQAGPVGSLSDNRFYCVACTPSYTRVVPVYRSNIGSYAQHCSKCKREVVKGAQGWPNLFDKRP